jgi:hypothetical protein
MLLLSHCLSSERFVQDKMVPDWEDSVVLVQDCLGQNDFRLRGFTHSCAKIL